MKRDLWLHVYNRNVLPLIAFLSPFGLFTPPPPLPPPSVPAQVVRLLLGPLQRRLLRFEHFAGVVG